MNYYMIDFFQSLLMSQPNSGYLYSMFISSQGWSYVDGSIGNIITLRGGVSSVV